MDNYVDHYLYFHGLIYKPTNGQNMDLYIIHIFIN